MSIYTIADLHLSFLQNKSMDIFGGNWENHAEKIADNWKNKVEESDSVILGGDFSWAMYLEDTKLDFEFLNNLPGNKVLIKGNHDFWWDTIAKMDKFIQDNDYKNIHFLYNNSYLIENKIIVGTRGWNILDTSDNSKMIKRENIRLELSIKDGLKKYGTDKEIIAFMHYPPINKNNISENELNEFTETLKKYKIHRCYYGHLHGFSHKEAIEGNIKGINYKLISADYLNFNLIKV